MFNLVVSVITALAVIPITIYLYLTWNFNYWRKRGVTTAEPLTIFGSLPNIVTRKRNFIFDIHDLYEKYKRNNHAVGIFITRKPEILLLDPKLIHDALVTNFTHFHDTITSSYVDDRKEDKLVVRSPFWCAGEEWKLRRSDAVPGVTQNRLKQAFPIWESSCIKLRKFIERKSSSNADVIETKDLSYRFALDVMCDFIWGIDSDSLTDAKESTVMEVSKKWTNHAVDVLSSFLTATMLPIIRKIRPKRFFLKETDDFFIQLQKDAIEMRRKDVNTNRADFLNHLLQLSTRKQLSLDDFTGYSLIVLLDGFETVGVVLMHTLLNLATHPHVQEKLRSEIQTALEEDNNVISYEKLIGLPYLEQCIYETLRLASVIPAFLRICTKPTDIEFTEGKFVKIPVGMVAVIPAYSLHLDEQYYPEPLKFNPERFDNNAHLEYTKKGILLPFGDGPRTCLGMRVGLLNVKSAVVEILRNYEITKCETSPGENSEDAGSFVMTISGDVMLKYKKLKK